MSTQPSHQPPDNAPPPAPAPTEAPTPPTETPPARLYPKWARWGLYLLALLFLALGIIGVFVPGLPTTVFILMAAWAAARSSPRLHRWLQNHPLFGSILRNWEAGGFVSAKAKRAATLTMLICVLIMLLAKVPTWAVCTASFCMFCVATWLWQRPEPPPSAPATTSGSAQD